MVRLKKMHFGQVFLLIIALCAIVECDGTELTRVARTFPVDLSLSRWSAMFRSLWSRGRFWDWPRNSVEGLLRLVASPDTRKEMTLEFRPDDGPRASNFYQRRYGYRGEWLINWLGSGFQPNSITHYQQPQPASFLAPPPLS